ncbi:heavy metal-associated isoprenylated plant protein 3 [Nicotiana tabacum]|uniref:Heavy metal-associated isoprenylated plant protein 3 n=2 Tax=Nicotiana TaxID=4085 RepID=A0A1S3YTC3_TOBAC|nr:PREDICTED: heavy metal-associated isoprenylated plant protein 3-like [Nicotiana tabacum]XP_016455262.1 PREDICTED: heavy metal-associated isoprenylated plant protein 3-like [Nicotiana tabacum]XP_016455263.1 PREDICTED: heavy metal-associated isoprenylated plant protein 3-like [Nicotiana tabacum]
MNCSCEGCSERVLKCAHDLHDLNSSIKMEENETAYKATLVGKFDPVKLLQKIEKKLKKKVTLISPKPDKEENKIDRKHKCKEPSVTTAVFKLPLNCDACNEQIYKIITRTGGCRNMKMDWEKNLVTVTGTIDVKSLGESLRYHLRKDVEILTLKDSRSGVYLPQFEYMYRCSTMCRSVTAGDLYHAAEGSVMRIQMLAQFCE